ncbi:HOP2 [Symbiodinium microadriaticum]|nr:HOP2 [Symbiodinium sp. KB8]CAE7871223.1 HOP2 [Symbiodinium microadriaticum]
MRKPACRSTTSFLRMSLLAVTWVVLCPVLAGLLKSSAHVPHHVVVALAEAAKYRGVSYYKRDRVFIASLQVRGGPGYIGRFKSAKQAAKARDRDVRRMYPDDSPDHRFRRKNWLNFPSEEEAAYHETPQEARERAMKTWGSVHRKEARSFELLKEALIASPYVEKYELVRLTGSSKADALFKLRGSSKAGLPVQLKAATSRWKQRKVYSFYKLLGYDGMLVVLVALDGGHFWAAAGEELKADESCITIGCASDTDRQVKDMGAHLVACFKDTQQFPHVSVQDAELQCSPLNRVEASAHRQLRSLFSCMNWSLTCPDEHGTTVDSLLEVGIGGPVVCLQEKASHFSTTNNRYVVMLQKRAGMAGAAGVLRAAYGEDDFDLLAACVLNEDDELQGVFLVPMSKLLQEGLVANRPRALCLHPPWSLPKRRSTRERHAWQLDFFLDLRPWQRSTELPDELKVRMEHLITQEESKIPEKRPATEAAGVQDAAAADAAAKQPRLAAPAPKKPAAPKAEAKEKKLTKEEMEAKVLEYMRQQNRPYNSQNVFDNLHGAVPKATVQTIMDTLCVAGKLVLKEYGKIKVYLAAQTAPRAGGDEKLAAAVEQAWAQRKDIQGQVDEVRKSLSQLESKHAAAREAKAAAEEVAKLEAKASSLRAASGEERVDEREVLAVEDSLKKAAGAWRKRKRLCVDALKTLGEGVGAKLQQLFERYGVDTDEDCGQVMPAEFS